MEDTLKQILNKLDKLDVIEEELKELKTDVKDLKGKIDKLAEKETGHFN